jgi:hypothetical protein
MIDIVLTGLIPLSLFTFRKIYDAIGLRYGELDFFCTGDSGSALAVQPAHLLVPLTVLVSYRLNAVFVTQLMDRLPRNAEQCPDGLVGFILFPKLFQLTLADPGHRRSFHKGDCCPALLEYILKTTLKQALSPFVHLHIGSNVFFWSTGGPQCGTVSAC